MQSVVTAEEKPKSESPELSKPGVFSPRWGSHLLFLICVILVVTAGVFYRLTPAMHRPLEFDEISSLQAYTSVGYTARASEMYAKKRFDLNDTVKGIARGLNYWKGPHHQMVNDFFVSVCTFFFGFSELTVRGTAMGASLLLAVALMWWIYQYCNSIFMAVLAGMLVIAHPYFEHYGQMCHGYTVSALLVALDVLLIEKGLRIRRLNLWTIGALIVLNYLIFLNLASSVIIWLAPLVVCSMFWRSKEDEPRLYGWFVNNNWKAWLFQALAVGTLVAQFVLMHLYSFLLVQNKFGIMTNNPAEMKSEFLHIVHYLFPGYWLLVAGLGFAGFVVMFLRGHRHWLAPVLLLSVAATCTYMFLMKKLPYPRTFGIEIVLALMCMAWLWRSFGSLSPVFRHLLRTIVALLLCGVLVDSTIQAFTPRPLTDPTELAYKIKEIIAAGNDSADDTLVLLPYVWAEEMRFYSPENDRFFVMDEKKSSRVNVFLPCFKSDSGIFGFRTQRDDSSKEEFVYWNIPDNLQNTKVYENEKFAIYRVPCDVGKGTSKLESSGGSREESITIWHPKDPYFEFDRLVSERMNLNSPPWKNRMLVTQSIPNNRSLLIFASDRGQSLSSKNIVAELESHSPGDTYVLTPVQPPSNSK